MPVITGAMQYPQGLVEKIKEKGINITSIDALSLAEQAGSSKAVNVVLIGILAKHMDIDKNIWLETIKTTVPAKFIDMNLKAFDLGYNF